MPYSFPDVSNNPKGQDGTTIINDELVLSNEEIENLNASGFIEIFFTNKSNKPRFTPRHPFKYIGGSIFLRETRNNQAYVCLWNNKFEQTKISLCLYLLSVKLGRYLEADEYAIYLDGDIQNNRLENIVYDTYDKSMIENPPDGFRFRPDPPYDDYVRGRVYYLTEKNRRAITFSGSKTGKPIIREYVARYIFQVDLFNKTGMRLDTATDIHHIDKNKMNDTLLNLGMLSKNEHTKEHHIKIGNSIVDIVCPGCSSVFQRPYYEVNSLLAENSIMTCGPDCKALLYKYLRTKDSYGIRKWIRENQSIRVTSTFKPPLNNVVREISHDKHIFNFNIRTYLESKNISNSSQSE